MTISKLLTSIIVCSLFLLGCSGGGGGNSSASRTTLELEDVALSPENPNAYTVVVYLPDVSKTTKTTIYDSLYANLTNVSAQASVPITRVLLTTVSPSNNGVFNIDNGNGSLAMQFLKKLAAYNLANPKKAIQVFSYPDVESDSPWLGWSVPSQYLSIKSCSLSQTTQDLSQKAMLLSICWASAVNNFIGSKIISGVVYDQQSNWLAKTYPATQITWTYDQTHNDQLLIGWVSANGIAASAGKIDLNFIEVYDLNPNGFPYYDTIALETVPKIINGPGTCINNLCSYDVGNATKNGNPLTNFFPGTQYTFGSGSTGIGAVGANIYQCAISKNSLELSSNSCTDAYTSNVDVNQMPSVQVIQALNYLWNFTPKQSLVSAHYGSGPQTSLGGSVVYLFSTQYVGPQKSYFSSSTVTSGNQCADPSAPANSCACMATIYNPNAFCGAENGFGAWGNYLSEFKNFTNLFLGSQGGNNCPGQSCSAGIYMYDYIPQAWYSQ
jgi:hypothetical protein